VTVVQRARGGHVLKILAVSKAGPTFHKLKCRGAADIWGLIVIQPLPKFLLTSGTSNSSSTFIVSPKCLFTLRVLRTVNIDSKPINNGP